MDKVAAWFGDKPQSHYHRGLLTGSTFASAACHFTEDSTMEGSNVTPIRFPLDRLRPHPRQAKLFGLPDPTGRDVMELAE